VFLFLIAHLFDDRTALNILGRQAVEMTVQVRADLAFRLCDEPQAPFIAQYAAGGTDRERAGIPEGTQPAHILAKLLETLLAPGQVIKFLIGSVLHLRLNAFVPGNRRVSLVQGLRRHLTRMIDTHQPSRMPLLLRIEVCVDDIRGGIFTGRAARGRSNRPQSVVRACEYPVQWRKFTIVHTLNYSEAGAPTGILRDLFLTTTPIDSRRSRMKLRTLVMVAALLAPFSLMAQDELESPWAGKATLGYLATSGNTDNSTLNTGFEVGYKSGEWAHLLNAAAINASESEITTAEAYDLGWKSERNLSDKDFLFGRVSWRKDRFGGYDTQLSETVGYGRRLVDTDRHKLNAEIGAGARQSKFQDGTKEDETIFRGGMYYKWLFSETAEFRQDLTVEGGDKNTYTESVTAISAKLLGELALVASYTIKNNSDVPLLTEKTDTYTALSLEYAF